MAWFVTGAAPLAAVRALVPVLPVPGWVMLAVTPLGSVLRLSVTLFHRTRMSGWCRRFSASAATAFTNFMDCGKSLN
jgi:hypothetical protein